MYLKMLDMMINRLVVGLQKQRIVMIVRRCQGQLVLNDLLPGSSRSYRKTEMTETRPKIRHKVNNRESWRKGGDGAVGQRRRRG